jgi:hypothetical protein
MNFPNMAGKNELETDAVLKAELDAAGIEVLDMSFMSAPKGEVTTNIQGSLFGWHFKRAWGYWVAAGPGIELEEAEKMHALHGETVRVAGDCGSPSPGEYYHGLACGNYHIDDQIGLKALADVIRAIVARHAEKSGGKLTFKTLN